MQLSLISTITALMALTSAAALPDSDVGMSKRAMSELENRVDQVSITYCNAYNLQPTCETRQSGSADCVSLPNFSDQIKSVSVPFNTVCVFWENYSCQGTHTGTFGPSQNKGDMKNWNNRIRSYRCCAGTTWCGDGL
ncbi:hypothetical protein K491DRAFT_508192 [Lophiostoma macrostomum CBS 122681]|uniref:Uncharacterized protein n=1 Tax=Lophiostoma macrostomum CBS 122681 TaxID=1314788 RepID=A0A6A6T0Z1_9PLEO|nr:hypothetical protein K491DRAFT_508192 [Lophiostoma macrostomum CBS 122681]